jgi:sulfoacetaldehyde dehydrogenase
MVEETGAGPDYPVFRRKAVAGAGRVSGAGLRRGLCHRRRHLRLAGCRPFRQHPFGSNDAHILRLGLELPVSRVIVNQAHCFATGGSFDNGLPFSLSMGCGTWGRNNFSDNMGYRQYLNTTRISRKIPPRMPTEAEIFGDYLAKHGA